MISILYLKGIKIPNNFDPTAREYEKIFGEWNRKSKLGIIYQKEILNVTSGDFHANKIRVETTFDVKSSIDGSLFMRSAEIGRSFNAKNVNIYGNLNAEGAKVGGWNYKDGKWILGTHHIFMYYLMCPDNIQIDNGVKL